MSRFCANLPKFCRILFPKGDNGQINCFVGTFRQFRTVKPESSIRSPWVNKWVKRTVALVGVGVLSTATYLYYEFDKRSQFAVANFSNANEYVLDQKPPKCTPSRQVRNPLDQTGLKLTLYQYQTCPFCCKVRTFLDYYGFSYDVVEVNSVTRKQTKWTDYRKVPFLVVECPGSKKTVLQLKDSSVIVSVLASLLYNKAAKLEELAQSYPIVFSKTEDGKSVAEIMNKYSIMYGVNPNELGYTKEEIMVERQWRKWTDETLVHTLSPNVYRTPTEAMQAFSWFSKAGNWDIHFSNWERWLVMYVGPVAMYIIGKILKKRHNLHNDVRQSLYNEADTWTHLLKKQKTPFLGGSRPNLADLSVYGVLTAIEGCQTFDDLRTHTSIAHWYDAVKDAVNNHAGEELIRKKGPLA